MIKIVFVCHGNICRSPMALFIMRYLIKNKNLESHFLISSRATSLEEIGNEIYYKAKETLNKHNIPISKHSAKRFSNEDYLNNDYIFVMEKYNITNLLKIIKSDFQNKITLLAKKEIEDPWYTNNFELVYQEIYTACEEILERLIIKNNLL